MGARFSLSESSRVMRFHHFLALAQVARRPVELPQAVQDRSLDPVLRITVEDHLLFRIVLARGVEQTQHAGVNQVVKVDVHRKVLMYPHRDGLHQRKVIEHNPVPDRIRNFGSTPSCGRS